MKHKLVVFASILTLSFFATPRSNAQWVQTNCPEGVWCFAVSGTNIYASLADFGGIYSSTDSGVSWAGAENPYTAGSSLVFALAVNGSSLFAGTSNSGIFRSTDDGSSWTSVSVALPHDSVYPAINTLAVSESVIFAGTDGGVFRSTNNGDSWAVCDSGLSDTQALIIVVNGTDLFVGMRDGLFLSTDNGISWKGAGLRDTSVNAITVSGSKLFASGGGYVFISTDNGDSWKLAGNSQQEPSLLAAAGTELFAGDTKFDEFLCSTNDGATWIAASTGILPRDQVLALAVIGSNIIAGTYEGAVYRRPLSDFNQSSMVENTAPSSSTALRLFPNPASGTLQILGGQSGEVHLFDLMGRERMNATSDGANTTLDVSGLEPGMYFLREGNESAKVEIKR